MSSPKLDEDQKSNIVEYLQAPKKKRKSYILFASGSKLPSDTYSGIETYIRTNCSSYALIRPNNAEDMKRLANRQIVLVVIDDQFCELEEMFEIVKKIRSRKSNENVPFLFLTDREEELVGAYNSYLESYQEVDNYVSYRAMNIDQICARIKTSLNTTGRRSRRYRIDLPVSYFDLGRGEIGHGNIIEVSIHGLVMQNLNDTIFKKNEQFLLNLPISGLLPPDQGEFMKFAAKVKRVLLSGNQAALTWEHVSDSQGLKLTKIVCELVNQAMTSTKKNHR